MLKKDVISIANGTIFLIQHKVLLKKVVNHNVWEKQCVLKDTKSYKIHIVGDF